MEMFVVKMQQQGPQILPDCGFGMVCRHLRITHYSNQLLPLRK
jgi:hypothetical protein